MPSWSVRAYRPGDETGINELFNAVFERHRPLDAWRWKFDRNPATPEKVIAVGEDEKGKIVGVYAAMPMRFRFEDRPVIATQGLDTCIASEYRAGGRLLVALYREFVRRVREIGAAFGFGFPNEVHYPVGKRLLKYVDLATLTLLDRRLSFQLAMNRRTTSQVLRRLGGAVGGCLIRLSLRWHQVGFPRDIAIREVAEFDEEFDALWERIEGRAIVSPIRDRAYLQWRYAENPEGGFRILRASRGERLVGYLVGKVREESGGVRVGYILDAAGEEDDVCGALLCRLLEEFRAEGVDWARCALLPHRLAAGPFAAAAFGREVGRMPGMYVIYDDSLDRRRFEEPSQWDLSLGDSDIFTGGA